MKQFIFTLLLSLFFCTAFAQNTSYLGREMNSYFFSSLSNPVIRSGEYDEDKDLLLSGKVTGETNTYRYTIETTSTGKVNSTTYYIKKDIINSISDIDRIIDSSLSANSGSMNESRKTDNTRYYEKRIRSYGTMFATAQWSLNGYGRVFLQDFSISYIDFSIR